jgi:ER-bound oxygenase mpaB/B'/Rubber oxygenase, catalytic domain
VTGHTWDEAYLDGLRAEADPLADGVVSAYFAEIDGGDPSLLFRTLVTRQSEDAAPGVAQFLRSPYDPPTWVEPNLVAAGQECFARWGTHVFTALYAAALPSAYACWKGVQVLGLTARLVTDTKRRLNETAQFHLDVMVPGGLQQGARGFDDVRHIRLMHAAIRWLIVHDSRADWDPAWGVPINQEDLLETLLTFTEIVFEVFDKTGVVYTSEDADAYLHAWSVVGHLLGVKDERLPLKRADTASLMPLVRRRQFGSSDAGRLLSAALLEQAQHLAPPGLRGLPGTTIRYYMGDAAADLLGIPPADWTRSLFGPLARLTRLMSAERAHRRFLSSWSDRFGRGMLQLAVDAERGGQRPPFAIPTELADRWGVTTKGARRAAGRPRAG